MGVAVRQSHLAQQQRQFDELSVYSNEVEVQLQSTAIELMRNTRFMSTLPPIQAIIDSRVDVQGADKGKQGADESEEVWQERLATIYTGLSRANPNYRCVYYTAIQSDQASPIVRVERHAGEMAFVRRLPASQLEALDDQVPLTQIRELSLGDILLTIRYQNKSAGMKPTGVKRQEARLLASTPVFNEATGEIFGLVTLELDLLGRVVQALEHLEQSTARILVTDSNGKAWVSDDPTAGINTMPHKMNATTERLGISEIFSGAEENSILKQSEGWIANRITLDPSNPQTSVGLVLELGD